MVVVDLFVFKHMDAQPSSEHDVAHYENKPKLGVARLYSLPKVLSHMPLTHIGGSQRVSKYLWHHHYHQKQNDVDHHDSARKKREDA